MTPKRRAAISITPPSISTLPLAIVAYGDGWPAPAGVCVLAPLFPPSAQKQRGDCKRQQDRAFGSALHAYDSVSRVARLFEGCVTMWSLRILPSSM